MRGFKTLLASLIFMIILSSACHADTCGSCFDCDSKLGDDKTIYLTDDIIGSLSDCIHGSGLHNITIDCQGHSIKGNLGYNAITFSDSSKVTIRDCNIISYDKGIMITGTSLGNEDLIHNVTVNGTSKGIIIRNSHNLTINDSIVVNSRGIQSKSIWIESSSDVSVYGNIINNTVRGIYIEESYWSDISNNTIGYASSEGIRLQYSGNNNISYNGLYDNSEGIDIGDYSEDNNIWMNNFSDDSNTFNIHKNDFCISGLDNYYSDVYDDMPELRCSLDADIYFNDTVVYPGQPVELIVESEGETNITGMNATIDFSSYEMQLESGNHIEGSWSYIYTATSAIKEYYADILRYIEADDDIIEKDMLRSFNVTELYQETDLSETENGLYLTSEVTGNATDIDNVTSLMYWNGSLVEEDSASDSMRGRYMLYMGVPERSGNYTINTTAYAGMSKTNTDNFYKPYGDAYIDWNYITAIAKGANTTLEYYIYAQGGDLQDVYVEVSSKDEGIIDIYQEAQDIPYLNSSDNMFFGINLSALEIGITNITITSQPKNGTDAESNITIEVKELSMETSLDKHVANTSNMIALYANITDNVTGIDSVEAEVFWNGTSRQNITLRLMSESSGLYLYKGYIWKTYRSGNYTVNITAYSATDIKGTEEFFINYGRPNFTIYEEPTALNISENDTQRIEVWAEGGDVMDLKLHLASNDTSIINLSDGQQDTIEIPYLEDSSYKQGTSMNYYYKEILAYNITGISYGLGRLTANATSYSNMPIIKEKDIEITGEADILPPNVTGLSSGSDIDTYNLNDSMELIVSVKDDRNTEEVIAEFTRPDEHKQNETMSLTGESEYACTFANSTDTGTYSLRIYASDKQGNTNSTEIMHLNVTDSYRSIQLHSQELYNRGENATILVSVKDINNNTVLGFNTSLNLTYMNLTYMLLPDNKTNTTVYPIGSSVEGIHLLDAYAQKYGNTISGNGSFNVTKDLLMSSYTTFTKYNKESNIRELEIEPLYMRGDTYIGPLNMTLNCYNDTSGTMGTVPLTNETQSTYTYTTQGDPQCYAPSTACTQFDIMANISDSYNNSALLPIELSTYCDSYDVGSGDDGGSEDTGTGGGSSFMPFEGDTDKDEEPKIEDFTFSIEMDEMVMTSGISYDMVAELENTGETELLINASYIGPDDNWTISMEENHTLEPKNKISVSIDMTPSIMAESGKEKIIFAMTSGNITKEETLKVELMRNPLVGRLDEVRHEYLRLSVIAESYRSLGIDTSSYDDLLIQTEELIEQSDGLLETYQLGNLESSIHKIERNVEAIEKDTERLRPLGWALSNKHEIAGLAISVLVLMFLLSYYILPIITLTLKLKALRIKESRLVDQERSTEREYFTRVIDKAAYSKIITEKHEQLTDIRTSIAHVSSVRSRILKGHLVRHREYISINIKKKSRHGSRLRSLPSRLKGMLPGISLGSIRNSLSAIASSLHLIGKQGYDNIDAPKESHDSTGKTPIYRSPDKSKDVQGSGISYNEGLVDEDMISERISHLKQELDGSYDASDHDLHGGSSLDVNGEEVGKKKEFKKIKDDINDILD